MVGKWFDLGLDWKLLNIYGIYQSQNESTKRLVQGPKIDSNMKNTNVEK